MLYYKFNKLIYDKEITNFTKKNRYLTMIKPYLLSIKLGDNPGAGCGRSTLRRVSIWGRRHGR